MEPFLTPILVGGLALKAVGSVFGHKTVGAYTTQPSLGILTVSRREGPPTTRPLSLNPDFAKPTALGTSVFEDAIKGVYKLNKTWGIKKDQMPDIALLMSKDQGYVAAPLMAYGTVINTKDFWGNYTNVRSDYFPRMLHDKNTTGAKLESASPQYRMSAGPFTFADGSHKPTEVDLHAVIGHRQLIDVRPTASGNPPIIADRPRQKFLGIF